MMASARSGPCPFERAGRRFALAGPDGARSAPARRETVVFRVQIQATLTAIPARSATVAAAARLIHLSARSGGARGGSLHRLRGA